MIRYADAPNTPPYGQARQGIVFAVRIARKYRDNIPTPKQLMADFGMSRATAYRWIAALKDGS